MNQIKYFLALALMVFTFFSCSDDSVNPDELNQESFEVPTSQFHSRSCATHDHMDKLLSDPVYKAAREKRMAKYEKYKAEHVGLRALCSNPTLLPVAVHYQGVNNPNTSCLISLAQNQIQILNDDFNGTNNDITNWTGNAATSFPGVSFGEACLSFQLADQNHPAGYGLTNGDLAVTINQTNGDFVADWSGYLNIYVQFGTGVLGYSPLGGAGNGDGVVVEATAFGSGGGCGTVVPGAPYNLGRTTTHEIGHYLNLDHIWGGGCGQDDGVADTPNSQSDYGGCPTIGASSCGSTDMHMNYMDYTNDACMYMFSAGQATVCENYVGASLNNISSNAANVISGTSTGGGGTTTGTGGTTGGGGTTTGTGGGGTAVTCGVATALTANVTGTTTADVSWTGSSSATTYRVRYNPTAGGAFTSVNTTATTLSIQGLNADTEYQYQVRVLCPTGWTAWTGFETFTTQANTTTGGGGAGGGNGAQVAGCDIPFDLDANVLSDTRVEISWSDFADASIYRVQYRQVVGGSWVTFNTSDAQVELTGLLADTEYRFRIRSKCPTGWTAFSGFEFFTTQAANTGGGNGGGGNTGSGCEDFTVEVTTDDYGNETTWYITDSNSNVVAEGGPYNTGQAGDVFTQDVCLADGCYTLSIEDSYGDGMCCAYGNGGVKVLDNTGAVTISSNGQFGFFEDIDFCVVNTLVQGNGGDSDNKGAARLKAKYSRTDAPEIY